MEQAFFWEHEEMNVLGVHEKLEMQIKIWQKALIVCQLQEDCQRRKMK